MTSTENSNIGYTEALPMCEEYELEFATIGWP